MSNQVFTAIKRIQARLSAIEYRQSRVNQRLLGRRLIRGSGGGGGNTQPPAECRFIKHIDP